MVFRLFCQVIDCTQLGCYYKMLAGWYECEMNVPLVRVRPMTYLHASNKHKKLHLISICMMPFSNLQTLCWKWHLYHTSIRKLAMQASMSSWSEPWKLVSPSESPKTTSKSKSSFGFGQHRKIRHARAWPVLAGTGANGLKGILPQSYSIMSFDSPNPQQVVALAF